MKRQPISAGTLVALAAWTVTACGPQQIAQMPGGQVWIDAPLHGDHLPEAPYDVISHANLTAGVANFELSVNGQVIRTDEVDEDQYGQTLAYVTQRWDPAGPGVYTLMVRAADVGGFHPRIRSTRTRAVRRPMSATVYGCLSATHGGRRARKCGSRLSARRRMP